MRSVVLASYNGERFIGEQLDSILAQLAQEDEVVVSDDASSDRTLEVVAQRGDPRVKIITNNTRVGYVGNFQRAIENSHGDIVYFSDQDDVWLPDKTRVMDAALRIHPCVASDAVVVDENLALLMSSYFKFRATRGFSFLATVLKPPIIGATAACQRAYLERLLPFPREVPHDFWLTANAAWDHALGIVDTPLILYRRHELAASPTAASRKRPTITILKERGRLLSALLLRRLSPRRRQ